MSGEASNRLRIELTQLLDELGLGGRVRIALEDWAGAGLSASRRNNNLAENPIQPPKTSQAIDFQWRCPNFGVCSGYWPDLANRRERVNSRPIATHAGSPVPAVAGHSRDDELVALVALARSQLLSSSELSAAVEYYGSAVKLVELAQRGELASARGQHSLPTMDAALLGQARREVAQWQAESLQVRTLLDDDYPPNLRSIHNRPAWMFFEGTWNSDRDSRAVAVVGSRKASPDGVQRARRLSRELVEAEFTVVSGMARGIDTAAHIAAIQAGGRTVAVMGTGINVRYPKENAKLALGIVDAGSCLVSSFLPQQPPTKWTFPVRNVVMSGLCLATAVVEAGETSGAKMQAEAALLHGRSVFLPSSLVHAHAWAQHLVTVGMHGSCAVEVGSTQDIVRRLELDVSLAPALSV